MVSATFCFFHIEHMSNHHSTGMPRYLEITVIDASAMAVVDSVDELLEIFPGVVLFEPPARSDFVEKFAACNKLHDYVYLCLAGQHLYKTRQLKVDMVIYMVKRQKVILIRNQKITKYIYNFLMRGI